MVVMMCLWRGKRVSFHQQSRLVCIGTVMLISNDWLLLKDVVMADGRMVTRFAVSKNRVEGFCDCPPKDEKRLTSKLEDAAPAGGAAPPPQEDEEKGDGE